MKDRKRDKIKYDRIRDEVVKKRPAELTDSDVTCLQIMRSDYSGLERELNELKQTCGTCMTVKPQRVKHCKTCDQCIIRMDHHCIWVNNCIGLHNNIYLIQLMFHLALGSLYYFIMIYLLSYEPAIFVRTSTYHRDVRPRS